METIMKKIIALIFTMIFSAVLLCGCNEDEKGNSVAYEDLEYGSTMRQILNGNIDLYFDGRFLTDEEMNAVSDYYYAVETDDLELFKTTQPEFESPHNPVHEQRSINAIPSCHDFRQKFRSPFIFQSSISNYPKYL